MKNLLKKFRENKKGFTLAELLVVVAIVGILVAISIPVFTAQLGKARYATNNANLRAAKAAAVAQYLTEDNNGTSTTAEKTYEYNAQSGEVSDGTVPSGLNPLTIGDDTSVISTAVYNKFWVKVSATKTDVYAKKE